MGFLDDLAARTTPPTFREKMLITDVDDLKNKLFTHYYPEILSTTTSVEWEQEGALGLISTIFNYNGTAPKQMTLDLFFDDQSSESQRNTTQQAIDFFERAAIPVVGKKNPPSYRINWKKRKWVNSSTIVWQMLTLDIEELMHDKHGNCTRANIIVEFQGSDSKTKNEKFQPTPNALDTVSATNGQR